jgi:sugar lactone lactonase YvrE
MIDERDLLERAAERFAPRVDAFERFSERRERHRRNQRLGAGIVAAAVILLLAGAVAWAIRSPQHDVPATPRLVPPPGGWVPPRAFGPDGALYVTDCNNARILRVEPSGDVTRFAGAGAGGFTNGFSGDGGLATAAHFGCPTGVAWDAAGRLFVVDHLNDRVRMIDTGGIVTTIAGDGDAELGDGGQAAHAFLNHPTWLAFAPTGELYVSDRDAARIRKIDLSGIITTVAGTGRPGFSGDGGSAVDAQINSPNDLVFDASGNLYFADESNNRVRKIDTSGVITTVAGNGTAGYAGDGGPAVNATMSGPAALAIDRAGNIYVADYDNNVIRRIDTDGSIETVAGNGADEGPLRYDGPARDGYIRAPVTLAIGPGGRLYITEDDPVIPRLLSFDPRTRTLSTVVRLPVT